MGVGGPPCHTIGARRWRLPNGRLAAGKAERLIYLFHYYKARGIYLFIESGIGEGHVGQRFPLTL